MMRVGRRERRGSEGGFTLVELMISMALIGLGMSWVAIQFTRGLDLWRRNWTDLIVQQQTRSSMARIVQAIRQAKPGTLRVGNETGEALYSRVAFTHVSDDAWVIFKRGAKLYVAEAGTTTFLADGVEALQFTYPSFQDTALLDVGLTVSRTASSKVFVRLQLTERVYLRNP